VSLRLPQTLSDQFRDDAPSPLQVELRQEQAVTLGKLGREVQKSLERLGDCHAAAGSPERAILLNAASAAVWHYFIQRELCGLLRHDDAIAHFAIPAAVLTRLGVR
jgi:hypothetical protein